MSNFRRNLMTSTEKPGLKMIYLIENSQNSAVRYKIGGGTIEALGIAFSFSEMNKEDAEKMLHVTIKNKKNNKIIFDEKILPYNSSAPNLQRFVFELYEFLEKSPSSTYSPQVSEVQIIKLVDNDFDINSKNFYEVNIRQYNQAYFEGIQYQYSVQNGKDTQTIYCPYKPLYKLLAKNKNIYHISETVWHPDAIKE